MYTQKSKAVGLSCNLGMKMPRQHTQLSPKEEKQPFRFMDDTWSLQ